MHPATQALAWTGVRISADPQVVPIFGGRSLAPTSCTPKSGTSRKQHRVQKDQTPDEEIGVLGPILLLRSQTLDELLAGNMTS